MRLDDVIVLGRTVPEASHRYGTRVCMAGYSQELGRLIRVYPLTIDNPLRARHEVRLELDRNPYDHRRESYKLRDPVAAIHTISARPSWTTTQVVELASTLQSPSIATLNTQRRSLGFIAIQGQPTLVWKTKTTAHTPEQLTLFEEFMGDLRTAQFLTGHTYPRIPYLEFRDRDQWHCLQLREWGCFEYLRKHDFRGEGLQEALGLHHTQDTWYALVGNMNHRRNVWLVIHLWRHTPSAEGRRASTPDGRLIEQLPLLLA
jgi:hypothetical protein